MFQYLFMCFWSITLPQERSQHVPIYASLYCVASQNYSTLIKSGQVVRTNRVKEFHHQLCGNRFYWLWVKRDSLQIRPVYGTSVSIEAWSVNIESSSKTCVWRVSPGDWARRRLARWPLTDHVFHQVTTYLNITSFGMRNWQAQWLTTNSIIRMWTTKPDGCLSD